jgi:hypothetical protein
VSYKREPTMPVMCATCPFRPGSPHAELAPMLAESALTEASRVCHSTGGRNAIHPRGTGKPARLCRGARDVQLHHFHKIGFLPAATDAAWEAKCKELNL